MARTRARALARVATWLVLGYFLVSRRHHCIETGKYLPTFHAECRQFERDITLLDALYVIKNGYREHKHDQFKEEWQAWNYAVRGITLQDDTVRVIISFDDQ